MTVDTSAIARHARAMTTHADPVSALWFTADGGGPSILTLKIHPFASEHDGRIPARLGIQVLIDGPDDMAVGDGVALVGGGFDFDRESVKALHRQLGSWLETSR